MMGTDDKPWLTIVGVVGQRAPQRGDRGAARRNVRRARTAARPHPVRAARHVTGRAHRGRSAGRGVWHSRGGARRGPQPAGLRHPDDGGRGGAGAVAAPLPGASCSGSLRRRPCSGRGRHLRHDVAARDRAHAGDGDSHRARRGSRLGHTARPGRRRAPARRGLALGLAGAVRCRECCPGLSMAWPCWIR